MEIVSLGNVSYAPSRTARRVYLFQRPISGFDSSAPMVQITNTETPRWWDSDLPLEVACLGSLNFTIFASHIGAIILDEDVCTDPSLTPQQKLLAGVVYGHRGPAMESSQDRMHMEIDGEDVKLFTALELMGHTAMTDIQLNDLLTDILRVGDNPNQRPAYHPLYWNCQDDGIRFSLLAANDDAGAIQVLASLFDTAKLGAGACTELAWQLINSASANALSNAQCSPLNPGALGNTLGSQFPSPLGVYTILSKGTFMLREKIRLMVWDKALQDRREWMEELAQQFPQLRGVGHGVQAW